MADSYETAMANAVEACAQSAKAAASSANTATARANAAKTSEINASTSKANAEAAAKSASDSADLALTYKQGAEAARDASEGYASDAEKSATELAAGVTAAEASANAASASANAAMSSANSANDSATDAANSALAAAESKRAAETAQSKAETAKSAAEAAQSAAENAAQNAAYNVAELLQEKVDAAETAQSEAETAQRAAETARDAAAKSATAASNSATDLADAVATAESLDGRLVDAERGLATVRSTYLPLTGGTVKGTLSVDTSNVIDRPALDLKVHTNPDDPARSLIVIRDETGTEFASIKVKRVETAAAYKGQIHISSEFLSTKLLNLSGGFYGPKGVAPTTGTWVDAGGAWKFDLVKGEIAITNNGWDSDKNNMPASKTFLKFTEIATTEKINAATESLDGRIKTIEGKGLDFKEDKRIVTSELTLPLVKQNVSPYGILYGPNGKTARYFCNCYSHVFQESTVAHVYSLTGSYIGSLNNVGFNFAPAHDYIGAGCLVAHTDKYLYGIFNGFAYNNDRMIVSKFDKDNGAKLIKSREYSRRGTVGSIWQNAGTSRRHSVGPVVWNIKTGHILVFGMYYTNEANDTGAIVEKKLGYGYIVFDEELNFVKWDEASGGFVSSEVFDETYLTLLPNASESAIVGFWQFDYWNITKALPTIVAISQKTGGTNGLGYLGAHDEIVPMTFQDGNPYYSSLGLDYIPLGGNRTSVDSDGLFTDYLPYIIYSSINSDSEKAKARNIILFNGSRNITIKLERSDDGLGFTYRCSHNYKIPYTWYMGKAISSTSGHMLLLGKWSSSYADVPLFLYYDSVIYTASGNKILAQAVGTINTCTLTSPQRGGYAREYHLKFAPCGTYTSPTGGYFLNI